MGGNQRKDSNSHYGPVTPRRVRAPGLHPPQNRHLVGRVPSPGIPIWSIMRIGDARTQRRFMPLLRSLAELVAGGLRRQEGRCRPNRLQKMSVNQGDIRERAVWGQANNSWLDRKSTRLNSSHLGISYAVFCL